MNKKLNTLFFLLGATLVNILVALGLAAVLLVIYAKLLAPVLPPSVNAIAVAVLVLGSMAGSFPIYRWLVGLFQKRVDMEKYFDPLVKPKRRRRP